ncbi:MAG: TIGR01212 family radical SAM protein [bacterium]|nr:TIGR01212 family radical SAM protein [bacterium]
MKRNIYFFKDYLEERYSKSLYRIPIDLGFSCPHRTANSSGCIFCSENGSRAVHLQNKINIKAQILKGIDYVEKRYNAGGQYIAYLQSYTNTNADINTIRKIYDEILSLADFKILIISTRPDCLPPQVLDYLNELSKKIEIWVELGVQTANDSTLIKINRAHTFKETEKAVTALNNLSIKTSAHIIIGLPDEDLSDNLATIEKINKLPFSGIKFHNLLILKNSPLGNLYKNNFKEIKGNKLFIERLGNINLYNEYEYISILVEIIRRTPSNWPVMRLIAEADKKQIILPAWNMSKGQIIELTENIMQDNNYTQGDLIGSDIKNTAKKYNSNDLINNLKIKTEDNSFTFYSPDFRENYHSTAGAYSEAVNKFIIPSDFEYYYNRKGSIQILDVGFGLGYNALAAINEAERLNKKVEITSLEYDTKSLSLALSIYDKTTTEYDMLNNLMNSEKWSFRNNTIDILFGDARNNIKKIKSESFDIVFLDAFSTTKNPELWTYDFIKQLSNLISNDGVIVTYSAAYPVRGAFLRNHFFTGITEPFGRRNGGTIVSKNIKLIKNTISEKDMNIITKSTAGTPYRDPSLKWTKKKIISYRTKLIKKLKDKGIPKWYK